MALPAAVMLIELITPPEPRIAMLVVPPPMSTIKCACSVSNSTPAPSAAASPSSIKSTRPAFASRAASLTDRLSSGVDDPGTPTTRWLRLGWSWFCTRLISVRRNSCEISKLSIVPRRIGRCTSVSLGSRPNSFNACDPTDRTSRVYL